jgi:hypothetical protein
MKFVLLLLPLLALVLNGCSSDPQKKGPKETADAFLKAMQFGDFEKAKTFCSEGTAQNLTMVETMSKLGANPMKENFEIKDVKEDGNYATVTYDQGDETGKILQLREDEGKWVVVMSKTDFGGGTKTDTDGPDDVVDGTESEEKIAPYIKYEAYREGKSAQQTAEAFMKALEFGNYDAAMRYGCKAPTTCSNTKSRWQPWMTTRKTKSKRSSSASRKMAILPRPTMSKKAKKMKKSSNWARMTTETGKSS